MPTSTRPVSKPPLAIACSWYCQRASGGGSIRAAPAAAGAARAPEHQQAEQRPPHPCQRPSTAVAFSAASASAARAFAAAARL